MLRCLLPKYDPDLKITEAKVRSITVYLMKRLLSIVLLPTGGNMTRF